MNQITVIGNLGKDVEKKFTANGVALYSFSVAVSEKWTSKEGVKNEKTIWFRCTAWQRGDYDRWENLAPYLTKGTKVMVQGKVGINAWIDQQGAAQASLEVTVETIELLGSKQQASGQEQEQETDVQF